MDPSASVPEGTLIPAGTVRARFDDGDGDGEAAVAKRPRPDRSDAEFEAVYAMVAESEEATDPETARALALRATTVLNGLEDPGDMSTRVEFARAACAVTRALAGAGLEHEVRPLMRHVVAYSRMFQPHLAAAARAAIARVRACLPDLGREFCAPRQSDR